MSDIEQFELGARVRLSVLGKSRMLRGIERCGRIIGFGLTKSVIRVKFDGIGYPVSLHKSYVERDTRAEIEARIRETSSPSKGQFRSRPTSQL